MKTTNYSKIADKYDKNQYRIDELRIDYDLKDYIDNNKKTQYNVLDLSCGTGLYLKKQVDYFKEVNINWYGLDLSDSMLEKAIKRVSNVEFTEANVEDMPYQTNEFDFISNNYAFHHYSNKEQALNEIQRVLKKEGVYKLHNISIHDMPNWWVYHYFPTAYEEDLKRYWKKELIYNELTKRGFDANLKVE